MSKKTESTSNISDNKKKELSLGAFKNRRNSFAENSSEGVTPKKSTSGSSLESTLHSNSAWEGSTTRLIGNNTHTMIVGNQKRLQGCADESDKSISLKEKTKDAENKNQNVSELSAEGSDACEVIMICYGPKGSFYVQFNDHSQAWNNIPQSLHSKLQSRNSLMPPLICLSISDASNWLAIFADGSFATSGFPLSPKLQNCLSELDAQPLLFKFAPHDGWVLVLDDGTIVYERLPSTLEQLLSRRSKVDESICELQISGYGSWFVRFSDGECEWEGLPGALEKLLISNIRKIEPDEHIVVTLSVCDGLSFFAAVGEVAEWVLTEPAPSLRECLEFAQSDKDDKKSLPESVTWQAKKYIPN